MKTFTMALPLLLCFSIAGWTQVDPAKLKKPMAEADLKLRDRYGYDMNLKLYPQKTPKDTLESIIKTIFDQRMEYMMAHLADPEYVDGKVRQYSKPAAGDSVDVFATALFAPRLGCQLIMPDEILVKKLKLKPDVGLVIDKITIDSPAKKARFQSQDILVALNGERVPSLPGEFLLKLNKLKSGVMYIAIVNRNGKEETLENLFLPEVKDPNRFQAFRRLVLETTNLYLEDPERIQELRMFARDAVWKFDEDRATGTLKQLGNRQVFLRLQEDRWFLENRQLKEK